MSQVVLHRSGMDPDFGYSRRLDVDLTHLIGIPSYETKKNKTVKKVSNLLMS